MDLPAPDYRLLRFWSDDYPIHLRAAAWQEVLIRKLLTVEVTPSPDTPFHVDACLRALPGVRFGIALIGPSMTKRTCAIAAKDNKDFYLIINLEGKLSVTWSEGEVSLKEGDAIFLSCADEVSFSNPAMNRLLCARFEYALLAAQMPEIGNYIGRAIDRSTESLRLLSSYLKDLDDNQSLTTPELRRLVVTQIYDLLTLVLHSYRNAVDLKSTNAPVSKRHGAIKKYILENLDKQDLAIGQVAAASSISPRQIQRFFGIEGTTFSGFVLAKRLQRAHGALTDPRQVHRGVSEIALSSGFSDVSYFNRAFRTHYGASPTSIRQSAALA